MKTKTPMEDLRTYVDAKTALVNCIEDLLEGYEFTLTNILDANGRCIPKKNRHIMYKLAKTLNEFKRLNCWHREHDKDQM